MSKLKGVCIGAGYFSQFHYDAWRRIPEAEIVALSDLDPTKTAYVSAQFGISRSYTDYREMFDKETPDFVDVITPPPTHSEICRQAARRGIQILCQKALAPSTEEGIAIVKNARQAGVRFMVHDNFRFQPWYREIKRKIASGAIGTRLHTLTFRSRLGDGWGDKAYIPRQPYFRDYPKLLIYETGVHFIDTFRYLAGEIVRVTAWLRRLNSVIKGEDCGLVVFEFAAGAIGQWDANRYNEPNHANSRYTFGDFLVEGDQGSLRLYPDGRLTLQELGKLEQDVAYRHEDRGFAGDCCYFALRHFIDRLVDGSPFETSGEEYLKTLAVQDAVYRSADEKRPIEVIP
jgi:D-apiose dehydrogenase